MKKQVSTLFAVSFSLFSLFQTSFVQAEDKISYVTESLSTDLRKDASSSSKVIGSILAGEKVVLIEKKGSYSLIEDKRNRQGWILTGNLTDSPSSKELVPALKEKVKELTLKLNRIDGDWSRRTGEMQRQSQYATQQSSSLIDDNARLQRELRILQAKNQELETVERVASREDNIQWFIYGGMVFAFGLLFGLLIPVLLPKKRKDGWS